MNISPDGFTRKAYAISNISEFQNVCDLIVNAIECLVEKGELGHSNYDVSGIYLNFYETGEMYTPNHNHPHTTQLIISLGGTRRFNLNTKSFDVGNGDVLVFGSQKHGVPRQPDASPRISIACFLTERSGGDANANENEGDGTNESESEDAHFTPPLAL